MYTKTIHYSPLLQSSTEATEKDLFIAFAASIEQVCSCNLSATPMAVVCFSGSYDNRVLLQTRLQQNEIPGEDTDMTQLVSIIQNWVEVGSSLEVGGNTLQADPSCDIELLQGATCGTEEKQSTETYKKVTIGLCITFGALVIAAVLITVTVGLLSAKYKPWRRWRPPKGDDGVLTIHNRSLK